MHTSRNRIARGVFAPLGIASFGLLAASQVNAQPAAPTGLTAQVDNSAGFDDTKIQLNWSSVGGATGYNIYRVENTPIQTQASVAALFGDTWTNINNVKNGATQSGYYDSATVGGSPDLRGIGRNVGVELTFPTAHYIGAVGFLGGAHDGATGHTTSEYSMSVGGTPLASNAPIPFQRSGMISQEFRPILATTVRTEVGGTYYDPDTGIAEVDVWEYSRLGSNLGATTFTDTGRTPGKSYTYYVTAVNGGGESTVLSNKASLKAGDRDDTNTGNSYADAVAGDRTNYTRGSFEPIRAKGVVPNPGTGGSDIDGVFGSQVSFAASSTEAGTGDVKRYVVYRAASGTAPTQIQTQALPSNGGAGVETKWDVNGRRAINAIDGDLSTVAQLGSSNYSEEDFRINFGEGRVFAMSGMAIYQGGSVNGYAPQHAFRQASVEVEGYATPDITLDSINSFTTTSYNGGDADGFATFGFDVKTNPARFLVGDDLILHLERGENVPGSREFQIFGIPLDYISTVTANGSANYTFTDYLGGLPGSSYDYYIMTEDFAGNRSFALITTAAVPEPVGASLAALACVGLLGRRRRTM